MAEKRPICLYGGQRRELAAGDTLPGGPAFIARSSDTTQSISQNVITKLVAALATTVLDTHNAWSAGTFTVPAGWAGLYQVNAMVTLNYCVDQAGIFVDVYKNNALAQRVMAGRQSGNTTWGGGGTCLLVLAAGDTVDMRVNQTSPATTTYPFAGLTAFSGAFLRGTP
ncbi:MAG: hypothetical protein Q8O33_04485 [Pseudomonadota bacterium]|nr:hypothetical protein [Pseudomonadota bacterium]